VHRQETQAETESEAERKQRQRVGENASEYRLCAGLARQLKKRVDAH